MTEINQLEMGKLKMGTILGRSNGINSTVNRGLSLIFVREMKFAAAFFLVSSAAIAAPDKDGIDRELISARAYSGCVVDMSIAAQTIGQKRAEKAIGYYMREVVALVGNQKFAQLVAEITSQDFANLEKLKTQNPQAFEKEVIALGQRANSCVTWSERQP